MTDLPEEARHLIWAAAHETPAVDLRVFFPAPALSAAARSGLDGLLTSPALLEEFFRRRVRPGQKGAGESAEEREAYRKSLAPGELADLVWRRVFLDHAPLSEAARTVLTTLGLFGLDVGTGDLRDLQAKFDAMSPKRRLEKTLAIANLELVLYPVECLDVDANGKSPPPPAPFRPVLSLTRLLGDWKAGARKLRGLGFGLKAKVDEFVPLELRRHLAGAADRLAPAALALDWPSGAKEGDTFRLVREAALHLCRERGLALLLAADRPVECLAPLWEECPEVNFLFFPSREEQLPAAGRAAATSRNFLLCGPDRPLSHPSSLGRFIECRLEESGTLFHACHSGASCPEELAGRWAHLRWTFGEVLLRRYAALRRTGWRLSEEGIKRDVRAMLGGNAREFLGIGR